jgi:hypothetical protein
MIFARTDAILQEQENQKIRLELNRRTTAMKTQEELIANKDIQVCLNSQTLAPIMLLFCDMAAEFSGSRAARLEEPEYRVNP